MNQSFWKSLLISPVLSSTIALSAIAQASPVSPLANAQAPVPTADAIASPPTDPRLAVDLSLTTTPSVAHLEAEPSAIQGQVTSVSQLTDVRPTDWAFQALQSLVERYGCIVGYPDRTYRGNQALTRFEFAAGLNACLDRVSELIAAATADLVRKEDLETLRKLQEEFVSELAVLRGRVDRLEARAATLERQQFSTTTKLNAEVVIAVAGVATGDEVDGSEVQKNTVLGNRVRLNFDTSFNGTDLLRTRLQASNLDPFSSTATFTPEGDLRFAAGDDGNQVSIDALLYQFQIGERTTVVIEANAGAIDDFTNTINPFLDGDGGNGALTNFATRNAIYYLLDGTGLGIRHQFSDQLELSLGYLASEANDPRAGSGLFNGPYGAIAQLTFTPSEALALGLTYVRAYNNDFFANGSTGSNNANFITSGDVGSATTNSFGFNGSFRVNPNFYINGSVGYTRANAESGSGDADIWNWFVALAFPDLLKKGNLGAIVVGMEPKVTNASGDFDEDESTSLHIEALFQLQLNDNLAITPGIIWLTAPDHNSDNSDVVIGTIRTTFTF